MPGMAMTKQRQQAREEARATRAAMQPDDALIEDDARETTNSFLQLLRSRDASFFPSYDIAEEALVDCTYASNLDSAGRLRISFLVL